MSTTIATVRESIELRNRYVELRIDQSPRIHFRKHLAHLHLLAAAVEAMSPADARWTVETRELNGQGIVAIEMAEGTSAEAAQATSTLQQIASKLGARSPAFPELGAHDALLSPLLGFELTTLADGLMVPQLQVTPPSHASPRQMGILLHLLAAAVELATPVAEQWTVEIKRRVRSASAVEIDLTEWCPDEANRAMDLLELVMARCHGEPVERVGRSAVALIQRAWPALAAHAWTASIASALWA